MHMFPQICPNKFTKNHGVKIFCPQQMLTGCGRPQTSGVMNH